MQKFNVISKLVVFAKAEYVRKSEFYQFPTELHFHLGKWC
jgi:hypothetical protein